MEPSGFGAACARATMLACAPLAARPAVRRCASELQAQRKRPGVNTETHVAPGGSGAGGSTARAYPGAFISIEGGDGAGKTTQAALLADALQQRGYEVCRIHEPGGTQLGERVRGVLLDASLQDVDATAELLLYEAARAQLVARVIAPALAAGQVVVCDRCDDSTTAYQGYGRQLSIPMVQQLNTVATGGLAPDRTVLLALAPQVGMRRALARSGAADRMEAAGSAFHQRVWEGFEQLAFANPKRFRVVDASPAPAEVAAAVLAAVQDALPPLPAQPAAPDEGATR